MKPITFPKDFYWGGATSSHQVEGRNTNNDWFVFEQLYGKIADGTVSGDACDHYSRFREDFALLKSLNHNAHRFSVEWSRVEPARDYISKVEVNHYRQVAESIRENGMEPFVTLHHFTTPLWLARTGGWLNPDAIERFEKFTKVMVDALGDIVTFWMPINEPVVYTFLSFMDGSYAPGMKKPLAGFNVLTHMLVAHGRSYRIIKEKYPDAQVGFNKHMRIFDPYREDNKRDRAAAARMDRVFNMDIIDALFTGETAGRVKVPVEEKTAVRESSDFLALNYYSKDSIKFSIFHPGTLFGKTIMPEGAESSHEGAYGDKPEGEYYPHGIRRLLKILDSYGQPVYVTENGVSTNNDAYRVKYMANHIAEAGRAMEDGVDLRGYLFWSTLDNFEWNEGYLMRFGMIHVDFETFERTVNDSAKLFGDIAKKNALDDALCKEYNVIVE